MKRKSSIQALYALSTTLVYKFDEMSNSLLHRATSIFNDEKYEEAMGEETKITISRLYEVAEGGKRIESYLAVLRGYIGGRPALIRGYKG